MLPQAVLPLLTNMLIAALFGISFLVIARLNPTTRRVGWMALTYGFGVMEPASHLGVALGGDPRVLDMLGSCSFLIGLTLTAPILSIIHRRRPIWWAFALIVTSGLVYFTQILPANGEGLGDRLIFQSFSAASMMLCAITAWRHGPATRLNATLVGLFLVDAVHFLVKPFLAAPFGFRTQADYLGSVYAVISQASTGVLLVAAGLLVLIGVLQSVVETNHDQARLDLLTGLPNRRALEEAFDRLVDRPGLVTMAVAILDLDHFKRVNDRLGHDGGDAVLRSVAKCLAAASPETAVMTRLGGEEFVLLLPDHDETTGRRVCEDIRLSVVALTRPNLPTVSVSIGLATLRAGETLAETLRRADQALYQAKAAGRNRCVVAARRRPLPCRPTLAVVGLG